MLQKTCLFLVSYPRENSNEMQREIQRRIALIYLVCLATSISTSVVHEILPSRALVEFDNFSFETLLLLTTPSPLAFLYFWTVSVSHPVPQILTFLVLRLHVGITSVVAINLQLNFNLSRWEHLHTDSHLVAFCLENG